MSAYLTSFFLVFAGLSIGYLLWHRDRRSEEAMRDSLRRDNDDLHASLKLAHQSHAQLDDRFSRQKSQLTVLKQLCDDWSTSREQAERSRVELEVELEDKNRRLEEAVSGLQSEKQRRIELEDETHRQAQSQIQKLGELDDQWRQRNVKLESMLSQRQTDLGEAEIENQRVASQLHNAESRLAELQSDLAIQKSMAEAAKRNANGLELEHSSIESLLAETNEQLTQSRAESAAAASQLQVSEDSLKQWKLKTESAQEQIEELQMQLAAAQATESQLSVLEASIQGKTEQLQKVTGQRDEALAAEKKLIATTKGLQHRTDNQEATIHRLRAKHDDAMENLKSELARRADMESQFEHRTVELENRLQAQLTQTTELEIKLQEQSELMDQTTIQWTQESEKEQSDWQNQVGELSETIQQLTAERDQVAAELEISTTNLNQTSVELESANHQMCELSEKIEELKTTCLRISELEILVQKRDQEDAQANSELQSLREKFAAAESRHQDLSHVLDKVIVRNKQLESESRQRDAELEQVRSRIKNGEQTIRSLRRERAAVLSRIANLRSVAEPDATVISFTEAMQQRYDEALQYDQEYGGYTAEDVTRGLIYTETPDSQDDLKQISGIAVVLEARLNDYGIYTFKQIKNWNPEHIEEFSRLLAFKDRIVRDQWLEQAALLYEQKFNKGAAA